MSIDWHPANAVTLLENGAEFFPALTAAIDLAHTEIFLETYIFSRDATGHEIAAALQRAAQRGVTVRVLVDGFGGREFVAEMMGGLVDAGVSVLIYRREVSTLSLRRRRLVWGDKAGKVGGVNPLTCDPSYARWVASLPSSPTGENGKAWCSDATRAALGLLAK